MGYCLGAILNLGIVRSKIGDIFIKDNIAYVYCLEDIAKFISDNLTKIKHTIVKTDITDYKDISVTPDFKEIMGTIANIRLDSLIATAFGSSRNSIIPLIESGKVFINSKMTTNNGASIKDGDIISVRGKGRFIFDGVIKTTKKGRNLIKIRLYS
ncbi:MAG: YlmH/Sll1252 family protein [Eubacterium sp.]